MTELDRDSWRCELESNRQSHRSLSRDRYPEHSAISPMPTKTGIPVSRTTNARDWSAVISHCHCRPTVLRSIHTAQPVLSTHGRCTGFPVVFSSGYPTLTRSRYPIWLVPAPTPKHSSCGGTVLRKSPNLPSSSRANAGSTHSPCAP